ncbi:hypothetical protein ACWGR3_30600 [Streptomyces albidoflavus]
MSGAPVIEWLRPGVGYTPPAAASMRRLEARLGRPHDCNSSYRDWDKQMSMHVAWERYEASGYRRDLYPGHSRALHPDDSMHCKGLADDSDDWTTPGFIELAEDHGWIRTAASDPTERHHFEYQWWRDNHRFDPAPAGQEQEDDMFTDEDRALLRTAARKAEAASAGIWQGGHDTIDGTVQRFRYGVLPVVTHSQIVHAGQLAGLTAAVRQLASADGLDLDAIKDAARAGAEEALAALAVEPMPDE